MIEQGRFIDVIDTDDGVRRVYAGGCKQNICLTTIDSTNKLTGRFVDNVIVNTLDGPTPFRVYGVVQECAKGPFLQYLGKNCNYPWGVSDRIGFKLLTNQRACINQKCPSLILTWDTGEPPAGTPADAPHWGGTLALNKCNLNISVYCLSDGQGPFESTTLADDGSAGDTAWTITAPSAQSTMPTTQTTHYLVATNFGFTVVGTAEVTNIVVEVLTGASANLEVEDFEVFLVLGGSQISGSVATGQFLTLGSKVITYAGDDIYWSVPGGFNPSMVNDPTFGVALRYKNLDAATRTVFVDYVHMTVICPGSFFFRLYDDGTTDINGPLPFGCQFPLFVGNEFTLDKECCNDYPAVGEVVDPPDVATHTLPIDFAIYGFRTPIFAAQYIDNVNGVPVYGYSECCTQLECQETRCCDMMPLASNLPKLIATISNKQGSCVCIPDGFILYQILPTATPYNWKAASPSFDCPPPPNHCEETFEPYLSCCDYGLNPQWRNFRWLQFCSSPADPADEPVEGTCDFDTFFLVFHRIAQGGSYTVTITKP